MAVSGSKAVFGDVYVDELVASCGNGMDFLKPAGVYFVNQSYSSCQKASMFLRKREQPRFARGYYICDVMQRNTKYNLPFGPRMKSIHTSALPCSSSGTAHDVSFDNDEQTTSFSEQYVLSSSIYFHMLLFSF